MVCALLALLSKALGSFFDFELADLDLADADLADAGAAFAVFEGFTYRFLSDEPAAICTV